MQLWAKLACNTHSKVEQHKFQIACRTLFLIISDKDGKDDRDSVDSARKAYKGLDVPMPTSEPHPQGSAGRCSNVRPHLVHAIDGLVLEAACRTRSPARPSSMPHLVAEHHRSECRT